MVGHDRIIEQLKKLAKAGKLHHAYLFEGSAMIGKRLVAETLAHEFEDNAAVLQDALIIAPDEKGTIGIDEARRIKAFLWQKPNVSAYRTAIIDDADRMTNEAENALLKIAEEPPASTLLILISSDPDALSQTLASRLHRVSFGIPPKAEVIAWLTKEFKLQKKAAEDLAKRVFYKPGLAARLQTDERLEEYLEFADKLLTATGEAKRATIKKILEDDHFDILAFLDAMMLRVAASAAGDKNRAFWHDLLELRQNAANFNLNPRLQLENLLN